MKILYDHQIFEKQNFGGISKYFTELLRSLSKDKLTQAELAIKYSNNEYLQNLIPYNRNVLKIENRKFPHPGIIERIFKKFFADSKKNNSIEQANKLNSIQKIIAQDFDVFHPTYYEDYFLDYIGDKPFVITVHDLIHQIFPEFYNGDECDKSRKLLNRANHIIAVSQNTKSDIINYFNIPEEKISVIYHGVPPGNTSDYVDKYSFPREFFLHIGHRSMYKNFYFALQSIADFLKKEKNLELICTGPPFNSSELLFLKKLDLTDKVRHVNASDEEIKALYQNAIALIYPSLYEGFGIPILEAFSNRCPVLCSDTSSFPEVGNDAVIYFEPKNNLSILNAINAIYRNQELREALVRKGLQQQQKFTLEKTIDETANVYSQVLTKQNK